MKEKIQSKLEALAHPEDPVWRRLAWITVELKTMARLLHSTIKQEENNKSRGQYKHGYWVDIIGQLKIGNSIYIKYYHKSTRKLNM